MNRSALFWMILMNVIWAGSYAAVKSLMDTSPAYLITSLRYIIAAIPMLIFVGYRYGLKMSLKDLFKTGLVGLATFTFCPMLMYTGVGFSRSADAAVLTSMEPLLVSIGAWIYLREKISPRTAIALFIAFCGVLVMSEIWKESGSIDPRGPFLIIAGVFFEAWYSVIGKELLTRHAAMKILAAALLIGCITNSAMLTMMGWWPKAAVLTPTHWLLLAGYLSFLCTMVGYTVWYIVLSKNPTSNVAVTIFTQPAFGILISWYFVGETPSATQLAGTLIILGAVSLALFAPRRTPLPVKPGTPRGLHP